MIYPEGNRIGEILETALIPNLEKAGIRLTMKAVPFTEFDSCVYAEEREMDMFYQAINFDILFDYAIPFEPDGELSVIRQKDATLYRLAAAMNQTEPGNILEYVRKWVAFEEKFNSELPMIPLYSNEYYDFFTSLLRDYNIAEHMTWSDAILGATKVEIPEYEVPMVEPVE